MINSKMLDGSTLHFKNCSIPIKLLGSCFSLSKWEMGNGGGGRLQKNWSNHSFYFCNLQFKFYGYLNLFDYFVYKYNFYNQYSKCLKCSFTVLNKILAVDLVKFVIFRWNVLSYCKALWQFCYCMMVLVFCKAF